MLLKRSSAHVVLGVILLVFVVTVPVSAQCPRWRRADVGLATIPMRTVYAYDSLHVWVSTYFGDILSTKDGWHTWNSFTSDTCCPPLQGGYANSFFFLDTLSGWIAGFAYNSATQSFRLHTTDGGNTWATQLDIGELQGRQILFPSRAKGLVQLGPACNTRDSFMISNDSGLTWQRTTTGIPACYISRFDFLDSLNGFASYHLLPTNTEGGLIRTRDGGTSWSVVPMSVPVCAGHKIAFLDTLNGWMWHCDPNVSNRYRFSRTHDGGITWDSLYTFNGDIWFYTFKILDTTHFWLAGINYDLFNASVQFSSDGGRTWIEQMPGVGDEIDGFDAADGNHAYAVGNSGYMYIYSPAPLNGLIGDLNQDSLLSPADVVLLLNRTFLDSPVCVPLAYIDFNNDCAVTSADVVLLLLRVFAGGPPLPAGCAGL